VQNLISIPYGAIKSKFLIVCNLLLFAISIPYGAIKSVYGTIRKTLFFKVDRVQEKPMQFLR